MGLSENNAGVVRLTPGSRLLNRRQLVVGGSSLLLGTKAGITAAFADAPQPSDPQYDDLMRYQRFFKALGVCCSLSDGRKVAEHIKNNSYEALIRRDVFNLFPDVKEGWWPIPDDKIINGRPMLFPVPPEERPDFPVAWIGKTGILYCYYHGPNT